MDSGLTIFNSFLAGIISFLSPCILALIPIYIGYITQSAKSKKQIIILTTAFITGIIAIFLVLSLVVGGISNILAQYKNLIGIIGGIILILMGLLQLGIFGGHGFNVRIFKNFNPASLNIISAFILGIIFGISFTPCIGPFLSSFIVLIIANYSHYYWLYIIFYGIGLIVPFVLLGFFFKGALLFLKKQQNIVRWFYRIIALVLIVVGGFQIVDNYKVTIKETNVSDNFAVNTVENKDDSNLLFKDQYDQTINLYDYKGKYIMLNFVASWCHYCKQQIPLLEEFQKSNPDVEIFLVMSDKVNNDGTDIKEFGKKLSLRVLNDVEAKMFSAFAVAGYPTAYYIGPDFKPIVKIPGFSQTLENLKNLYKQVQEIYKDKSSAVE